MGCAGRGVAGSWSGCCGRVPDVVGGNESKRGHVSGRRLDGAHGLLCPSSQMEGCSPKGVLRPYAPPVSLTLFGRRVSAEVADLT